MKSKVKELQPSGSDGSTVGAVVIDEGGPTLPADVVIMGVGVAPATGFLRESGFKLERDGGILVDEYLRVQGEDSVYAIGESCTLLPSDDYAPHTVCKATSPITHKCNRMNLSASSIGTWRATMAVR